MAAALICLAATAHAQYVQQGGKVVVGGAAGAPAAGMSVAVSADGSTAIVGGPADNQGAGAAWVFTRSNGAWVQQGGKLVGTGSTGVAGQGRSVALSADGNTAIVGGINDNAGTGAVWIFTRSNGIWSQQGPKLWGTVLIGLSQQGISVALSADGNTALEGGNLDTNEVGAAWVFTRKNGVWSLVPDKLVGTGSVGISHEGSAVALSADGNTAILGGPGDNSGVGAMWVFTRTAPGAPWTQQGSKVSGAGATAGSGMGTSVALSSDGNTAVVGGAGDSNNAGAVWMFTRTAGQWSQQGPKLQGSDVAASRLLGQAVAVSGDGNTALAGGPGGVLSAFSRSPSVGATWVFTRSNNGLWSQQVAPLVGSGTAANDALQGTSLAVTADGTTALIGGPADNVSTGAVWVFARPIAPVPPVITTQPASQTIANGQTATLTVAASGGSLAYQWYQGTTGNISAPAGTNSNSFTTPALTATTSYWVRVTNPFGTADSNTAVVTVSPPPNAPAISQVSNAASQAPVIAPNTWVQISGTNLAPPGDTRSWQGPDFVNNQMPKQLDGVSATVNGKSAYVSYISPTQVNILTPPDAIEGQVQVQLTNGANTSPAFAVPAQVESPSFFVIGAGPYVAAEHANFTYLGPASLYPGATTPAKPGETVLLYGNGFGVTSTPVASGSLLQSGTLPTLPVIRIGGIPSVVQFAGLVLPGEYQFNVVVPLAALDGDNTLTATYDGGTTQAGVLLTVQR